jgi:hypothetical protein
MCLDAILVNEPLTGALEPRLGKAHVRTLTVMGFPSVTYPGILELNRLAFPYRWATRAIAVEYRLGCSLKILPIRRPIRNALADRRLLAHLQRRDRMNFP